MTRSRFHSTMLSEKNAKSAECSPRFLRTSPLMLGDSSLRRGGLAPHEVSFREVVEVHRVTQIDKTADCSHFWFFG